MEEVTEVISKIDKKRADFSDLTTRMDADFELWSLRKKTLPSDYDILVKANKGIRETDVLITSNDPRTFADKVHSTLSGSEMQISVRMAEDEGEDKRADIGKLERLFSFAFEKADERLRRLLLLPLKESLIWFSAIRGWTSARILVYKVEKDVIFDFLPLDPRWLIYEVGAEGLSWSAYETFRSSEAIFDEYGLKLPDKADNSVIDYWKYENPNEIINGVICNKEWSKKPQTYNLPSIPILIMPVATRPQIHGSAGSESGGYGESIFAPVRDIYAIRDKFASIVATHANLLAKQPLLHYAKPGISPIQTTAYFAEAVLNLVEGEQRIEPAPMKEISPTVVNMLNWLSEQVERGSLPNIPIGSPPPSGTMYNLAQEAGNKVFNPQLKNLSYIYADICHLIEEQLIVGKLKVKTKTEEKRKYYETEVTPVDLRKPHIIKVEFTARTPWTQMDTYQVADMAKRLGLPDEFIQEYILKLPDPKGLGDQVAIEMAEHSPKLAILRAIDAFMKHGRQDEAMLLIKDMYNMAMNEQLQGGTSVGQPGAIPPVPTGEVGQAERTLPF